MLINLKVKTLDARTHEFSIDNDITVREFKDKIAEKTNISADNQRLIYQGRVLADEKQIKEYDVDGKVLHVAERPPFSQRDPRLARNPRSNDDPRVPRNTRTAGTGNMRNSPFFRALDGMLVGTMTIPVNAPGPAPITNGANGTFASSSSFCMNRITVARHMINCANNIAAYLENPEVGLNNPSLDILERGRWTMESTVVEVGVSAAELPRNQNLMDMVQGAVTAALSRNNPGRNYTVVQLPSVYASDDGALGRVSGSDAAARANANNTSDTQSDPGVVDLDDGPTAAAAVIIEDVIETEDGVLTGNGNTSESSDPEAQMAREGLAESIAAAARNLLSNTNDNSNGVNDANGSPAGPNQADGGTNRRRTGTIVLSEVMDQYLEVQTRLNPFISQYREMLRNEPSFEETDTAARESAQRVFDRVSEAFHYLSHAQHAISDLMLDLSQPAPRYLTCRPILVEQSGYIRSNNILSPNIMTAHLRPPAGGQQQTAAVRNNAATAVIAAANAAEIAASAAEAAASAAVTAAQASGIADAVAQSVARTAAPANDSVSRQSVQALDEPVDDPDVTPNVPPNGRRSSGSANAQNTTADTPVLRLSDPPRFRLYVPYNPQAHLARLIQAAFNSTTNDAELRLQISPPNMVSINVPVITTGPPVAAANAGAGNAETNNANENSSSGINNAPSSAATVEATSAAAGSNDTPIGVSAITLPTTSTQTRSTSRPQIQIGANNNWNGRFMPNTAFDRFLPCNSHHIREPDHVHASNNNQPSVRDAPRDVVDLVTYTPTNLIPMLRRRLQHRAGLGVGSTMTNNNNSTDNSGNGAVSGPGGGGGSGGVSNSNGGSGGVGGSSGSGPAPEWAGPERRLLTFGNRYYHNTGTTHTTSTGTNTSRLSSLGNRNHIDLTDLLANLTNRAAAANGTRPVSRVNRSTQSTERVNATTMTEGTRTNNRQDPSNTAATSSAQSLNTDNLRTQLRNFLSIIVFEGAPINDQTIPFAVNRALSWFGESLLYLPQYEKPEYNSRDSVCNILRATLTLIIKLCSNVHDSSVQFVERLRQICEQFRTRLYSVLIVCVGSSNAELYWGQLMRLLLVPLESHFRNEALQFLCIYLNPTIPANTDTADAEQFLVLRRSNSSDAISTNGIDINAEVSDPQQSSDGDIEMAEVASTSDSHATQESGTEADETEVALPIVVPGSEHWHCPFPNDWLPVITRDLRTQSERPINQPPYSEAYISGMSAKRRKIIQSNKPPTNVDSLIAASVRRAMQVNGISASTTSNETLSADAVTSSIAHDSAVQSSYTEAVRNSVRERLKTDPDYKKDKYPQTSKFINNK